jgi:hypothetical protein
MNQEHNHLAPRTNCLNHNLATETICKLDDDRGPTRWARTSRRETTDLPSLSLLRRLSFCARLVGRSRKSSGWYAAPTRSRHFSRGAHRSSPIAEGAIKCDTLWVFTAFSLGCMVWCIWWSPSRTSPYGMSVRVVRLPNANGEIMQSEGSYLTKRRGCELLVCRSFRYLLACDRTKLAEKTSLVPEPSILSVSPYSSATVAQEIYDVYCILGKLVLRMLCSCNEVFVALPQSRHTPGFFRVPLDFITSWG